MKKKVVLAFSGGLDTSFCAVYLSKVMNLEVHSITVNTGGFTDSDLNELKNKAKSLGIKHHHSVNIEEQFYQQCLKYLIYGNILRNNKYPLSVSAERIFQAISIAEYVRRIKAKFVAHGSTGAGNDQVRFDMVFNILIPDVEILTPVRDQKLSRKEELEYLKKNDIDLNWYQMKYSINKGLWGTSIGGNETLTSDLSLPESAFPTSLNKNKSVSVEIEFKKGQLETINDKKFKIPVEAIKFLNDIASPYGIGRDCYTGDTILGTKGRVGFEAAAPILIIKAHDALEKHTLTKWQIYWKDQLSYWYGMHLHEGHFLDPVMRDIEKFMEHTQETVNGIVYINLYKERFEIAGIKSPNDLMSEKFGSYGEKNIGWTGQDVKGFSKISSNQTRIYDTINKIEIIEK